MIGLQTPLNLRAHPANAALNSMFGLHKHKLRATGKRESQLNLIEVLRVISQDHGFMFIMDIFSL